MKRELIDVLKQSLAKSKSRFMLGICGAPGSGKSTLADWVVTQWNQDANDEAVLVPMDGYHFSNEQLVEKRLLELKGIPSTFDVASFLEKLAAIKNSPEKEHGCPRFDRSIEASIPDAIKVKPHHKVIVVEGNYLLLDAAPWEKLKVLFDETWFIQADEDLILPRLISRHMSAGKSEELAQAKVNSTDLPNARLVAQCAPRADRIIKATTLL